MCYRYLFILLFMSACSVTVPNENNTIATVTVPNTTLSKPPQTQYQRPKEDITKFKVPDTTVYPHSAAAPISPKIPNIPLVNKEDRISLFEVTRYTIRLKICDIEPSDNMWFIAGYLSSKYHIDPKSYLVKNFMDKEIKFGLFYKSSMCRVMLQSISKVFEMTNRLAELYRLERIQSQKQPRNPRKVHDRSAI